MKKILIAIALSAFATTGLAQNISEKWEWGPGKCTTGVYRYPRTPFAVTLFCEDALGTYMSVIYLEPIGAPSTTNGRWKLEDRYWHDPLWGSDITGFKWAKDGLYLLVSTSPIYGSGGLFELNLESRTAKQLLPKGTVVSVNKPGPGYNVSGGVLNELKQ
jgi:hypothetical protein